MPIICFFGTDGSGKSTLAKALTKRLNSENFRVKLSWMRGTHTLLRGLSEKLVEDPVSRSSLPTALQPKSINKLLKHVKRKRY